MRETAINLFLILLVTLGFVRVSQVLTYRCDSLTDEISTLERRVHRLQSTPGLLNCDRLKERFLDLEHADAWRRPVITLRKAFFQSNAQYVTFESYNRWSHTWQLRFNYQEDLTLWKTRLEKQGLASDVESKETGWELKGSL